MDCFSYISFASDESTIFHSASLFGLGRRVELGGGGGEEREREEAKKKVAAVGAISIPSSSLNSGAELRAEGEGESEGELLCWICILVVRRRRMSFSPRGAYHFYSFFVSLLLLL